MTRQLPDLPFKALVLTIFLWTMASLTACNTTPAKLTCGTERAADVIAAIEVANGTAKFNINDRRFAWTYFDLKWMLIKNDHPDPWVRERIQRACDRWSEVSTFTFTETTNLDDANIQTGRQTT